MPSFDAFLVISLNMPLNKLIADFRRHGHCNGQQFKDDLKQECDEYIQTHLSNNSPTLDTWPRGGGGGT